MQAAIEQRPEAIDPVVEALRGPRKRHGGGSGSFEDHRQGAGRCLRCRGHYTSGEAPDARLGIRQGGRYLYDVIEDGPELGQHTRAFCNVVEAEETRRVVR